MSISAPFIARPIATCLLAVAVLLGGALGYGALPVSALPQVDFPTIVVTTTYPGAGPETMATLVTAPLERQLGQINGITTMQSSSAVGVSEITLQFDLTRSIDGAAQDVQSAINAAQGILPSTLPYPPTYNRVNPADAPILSLAVSSDTMAVDQVADAADTLLQPKLSQIEGVGRVVVLGGLKPAIRVQLDPARLAAYGLSLEDVRTAISNANVSGAKGSFDGQHLAYAVGTNDQLVTPEGYRSLILTWRAGSAVRLSDVGTVTHGVENDRVGAWFQGRPAVILDVQRQPGANIVQTADAVREELPELIRALPPGIRLEVAADRTTTIRASVSDVQGTLLLAMALVVLVIFLFLRSWRATLIPAVALPLSLIGTFGVMSWLDYGLDNLSLMALTVASGFVVDDAIVMIENVVRYIEEGVPPLQAAFRGAGQIGCRWRCWYLRWCH
jgi:multidrug efflux pump